MLANALRTELYAARSCTSFDIVATRIYFKRNHNFYCVFVLTIFLETAAINTVLYQQDIALQNLFKLVLRAEFFIIPVRNAIIYVYKTYIFRTF